MTQPQTATTSDSPLVRIPIYFSADLVSHPSSFSPSARKPQDVVNSWLGHQFPIDVHAVEPLDRATISLAHAREYVDGVLDLKIRNGFGGLQADVAKSLPYTSGSMLQAARAALQNGKVSVSPTSGFHHAGYRESDGYCTFNGLMIAACALLQDGLVARIGILDCDQHFGNGTAEIIQVLGIGDAVRHVTANHGYVREAAPFLAALPALVESFSGCDLMLYQAGADPHVDDPLGGWMTTEQLLKRDEIVFGEAARRRIPIAWNLAGGYQQPLSKVLEIHDNTMRACMAAFL